MTRPGLFWFFSKGSGIFHVLKNGYGQRKL